MGCIRSTKNKSSMLNFGNQELMPEKMNECVFNISMLKNFPSQEIFQSVEIVENVCPDLIIFF